MRKWPLLLFTILLIPLAGCATEQYKWGNYETALYQYYKNPGDLDGFAEELTEMIEKGEPEDRVPPGVYAEYGYVLYVQEKNEEAISYFKKEKNKWPESKHLMDIMIETATAN